MSRRRTAALATALTLVVLATVLPPAFGSLLVAVGVFAAFGWLLWRIVARPTTPAQRDQDDSADGMTPFQRGAYGWTRYQGLTEQRERLAAEAAARDSFHP